MEGWKDYKGGVAPLSSSIQATWGERMSEPNLGFQFLFITTLPIIFIILSDNGIEVSMWAWLVWLFWTLMVGKALGDDE
jgi:hypothetical protein